jgi:hypothetical protein
MMTEEQIIARLQAVRLDRPRQPAPPKPAAVKAEERFAEANQPTVAIIDAATAGNTALARRVQAERKELGQWVAEGQDPRMRYQRELDRWWQSKLDAEAALDDGYVEIGGFREPRYRTTCHRGKGDPDYGL